MNQRQKRARDRRRSQDIGASTIQTGGHVAHHRRGSDPVVRTPQKATGDVPGDKARGLAKASPFFKKLKDVVSPKSQDDEKKAIAGAKEDLPETQETAKPKAKAKAKPEAKKDTETTD